MTQHTIRRRCVAFLAIGAMAALAMLSTAQAAPQLADLGVKQSMSVKASNGESLEGKDLRAIQLATYTAASVDGNTIVGYDLTTNTALASDITAAAKAAGATDTNLTVNGKNDPMVWVVKNLARRSLPSRLSPLLAFTLMDCLTPKSPSCGVAWAVPGMARAAIMPSASMEVHRRRMVCCVMVHLLWLLVVA